MVVMQKHLVGIPIVAWTWLVCAIALPAGEKFEVTQKIPAFDPQHPELQMGLFNPPLTLEIEDYVAEAGMYRVLYKSPGGKEARFLCRPDSLGKKAPDGKAAGGLSSLSSGTTGTNSPAPTATEAKPGAAAEGKPAAPDPALPEVEVEFSAGSRTKTLTSTTGIWELPSGTYEVKSFLLRKVSEGHKYAIKGASVPVKYQRMDVSSALPLEMKLGPPLTLSIMVDVKKKVVSIRACLTGREDETYLPALMQGNRPDAPPKFRLVDDTGKVLNTGKSEYTSDGICAYTWRAPSSFRGKFKVEIDTDLGPFEVKKDTTWFLMD